MPESCHGDAPYVPQPTADNGLGHWMKKHDLARISSGGQNQCESFFGADKSGSSAWVKCPQGSIVTGIKKTGELVTKQSIDFFCGSPCDPYAVRQCRGIAMDAATLNSTTLSCPKDLPYLAGLLMSDDLCSSGMTCIRGLSCCDVGSTVTKTLTSIYVTEDKLPTNLQRGNPKEYVCNTVATSSFGLYSNPVCALAKYQFVRSLSFSSTTSDVKGLASIEYCGILPGIGSIEGNYY